MAAPSVPLSEKPVQKYIYELIKWLEERKITLDDIITHSVPLAEAPHTYEIFSEKQDGCVKWC